MPAPEARELWPLIFVDDIGKSIAFYRDRLGFELVGDAKNADGIFWCRVKRGGCSLMLQQADPKEDGPASSRGKGVVFYFLVDDADAMHADLTARGLKLPPPETAIYGMRQVELHDPDGYSLCFESKVT